MIVFIVSFVGFILLRTISRKFTNLGLQEGQALECVWTLLPALVLIHIAIPSLILLYTLDDTAGASLTIKVVGHQ